MNTFHETTSGDLISVADNGDIVRLVIRDGDLVVTVASDRVIQRRMTRTEVSAYLGDPAQVRRWIDDQIGAVL